MKIMVRTWFIAALMASLTVQAAKKPNVIVIYTDDHGWADMKKAGYVLEKSVKREPYLEHGFMAGSNMVMLRALKRAVEGK